MHRRSLTTLCALLSVLLLITTTPTLAGDWPNSGGNAGRYGLSTDVGPTEANLLWSGGRSSLIAWHPVTEGNRVFMIRQYDWAAQAPNDAWVVAMDLTTGDELWAIPMPADPGDWTPWIAGVMNGMVYVSRGGNGASVSAPVYAFDVTDGQQVWVSVDEVDAGAYDGVVFAPDGDLVIASFRDIWRINGDDGTTDWTASRQGSVSGNCGGALHGDAFYVVDSVAGGHIIVRFDLATGTRMHESPIMPGFLLQMTPMVGPDGTVYLSRTQNNPAVDFYYAFTDTGSEFVEKWHIPSTYGASAEFAIGPDGSIYFTTPGPRLSRIDPATGGTIDEVDIVGEYSKARMATDAAGNVFFSNGGFSGGRLFAYEADLTPLWDVAVTNINIGGPSIGNGGVLVVCGVGSDVRAYRNPATAIAGGAAAPVRLALLRSAPNPFRSATRISFTLPESAPVSLDVYDVRGSRVHTLVDERHHPAGEHALDWDGRGANGERLAAGVYFYRLDVGDEVLRGRTLLIR